MNHHIQSRQLITMAVLLLSSLATDSHAQEANYDESMVPHYQLPDPLKLNDGTTITTAEQWLDTRRPEVLELFREHVYGHVPRNNITVRTRTASVDPASLDGNAVRKEVTLYFSDDDNGPRIDLLIFLPAANADRPVPAFVGLNFGGNHTIHPDDGIRLTRAWVRDKTGVVNHRATDAARGSAAGRWPVDKIVSRGYALVTAYYGDIDPDFDDGFQNGVHSLFYGADSKPAANEWGSIATWAWGLSRILDYIQSDAAIDSSKVSVMGHSRLGKTALWAGAADERFALVVSNNSGCGGAALSRRRFGESVKRINTSFPHWFCDNFQKYNDHEDQSPVDQHMLISLIAPRPVLICSAAEDRWADPHGEFLSAYHAAPVYRLLGTDGIAVDEMPALSQRVMSRIGYHIRPGKHDVLPEDWDVYLDFADRHLR